MNSWEKCWDFTARYCFFQSIPIKLLIKMADVIRANLCATSTKSGGNSCWQHVVRAAKMGIAALLARKCVQGCI